jgi:hypothetical protein
VGVPAGTRVVAAVLVYMLRCSVTFFKYNLALDMYLILLCIRDNSYVSAPFIFLSLLQKNGSEHCEFVLCRQYIYVCMCLVCFILRCNVSSVLYACLHVLICVQHTSMKKHSCEIDG